MSETCQKLAFTHPIVVLKSGLKNNWMKKLDRVNRPLKDKRGSSYDFMFRRENHIIFKCINKDAWDLYPVYKKAFYCQRQYIPTMKEYHDSSITEADRQRFTHIRSSSLNEHIQ